MNNKSLNSEMRLFLHYDSSRCTSVYFIWLMSNEDNFIINQLSDMILKLHSSRNDIIQN
jgi:hypothetical protein